MSPQACHVTFAVQDYDLGATLTSGQAFRWQRRNGWWEGVIGNHWVRLCQLESGVAAEAISNAGEWAWLTHYLQLDVDISSVLLSFPDDEPMRAAGQACRGLRLLRQDPWECLASFILSSTKQIVQIQQIVSLLCERFGSPVVAPAGHPPIYGFPTADRLAACSEKELRGCKMGFRAPNLLRTAQMIAAGEVTLSSLHSAALNEARAELLRFPGVGEKIANCVLLFAYGFQQAFPVDVWVRKALRDLYFTKRRPTQKRLERFAATHFGVNAGYAQQYLFHYMRVHRDRAGGGR